MADLFPVEFEERARVGKRALGQFFCPEYAAARLVDQFFPNLSPRDFVVDAGCGPGAFLKAIPREVPAIGVEIDPELVRRACANTGREVIHGDFQVIPLPQRPTVIVGNPPFDHATREGFLRRAAEILPHNGQCGWILPGTALSFASTVEKWRQWFSIRQVALPRDLYPRISYPLSFVMFSKDGAYELSGFALFDEASDLSRMPKRLKLALVNGRSGESVWKTAVREALSVLGGRGRLEQIYEVMALRLPRSIRTWQETIRRTLQEGGFLNVGRGEWALPA